MEFKKKVALVIICLLFGSACLAASEAGTVNEKDLKYAKELNVNKELKVTYDIAYLTKWLSKGAAGYGNKGALFNTLNVDLYGTGFGVKVCHRNATSSGYVDKQRFDYRPYYKNKMFEDTRYLMNYNISVGYEHYYGLDRKTANTTWEWIYAFSWPKLISENLVPSYIAHYEYPADSGTVNARRGITGWVHRFKLDYFAECPELLSNKLCFSSEVAYTDGLGGAEHDWSYATFGLSTKFDITEQLAFIPGIYHQISMEKTVNSEKDVTYGIFCMRYTF